MKESRPVTLAALLLSVAAPARAEVLTSASSDEHIWVLVPAPGSPRSWVLRHHAALSGSDELTQGIALAEPPEKLAAAGDRLWLVNAPEPVGDSWRRSVFTLEVRHNPVFDTYYYDPPGRLGIAPSLEGGGRLAGFTGTGGGPVALLVSADGAADLESSRLLRLESSAWIDLPLPDGFAGGVCRLAAAGEAGRELVLLAAPKAGGTGAVAWWLRPDPEGWRHVNLDPRIGGRPWSLPEVAASTRVGVAAALILTDLGGGAGVAYLRPGQLLPLGPLPVTAPSWTILGVRDGLRLVEMDPAGGLSMRRIDSTTGAAAASRTLTGQRLSTGPIFHLLLVASMAVGVLLVLFLVRGGSKRPATLGEGLELLPLPLRFGAAAIDVALGAGAALALLRVGPADLALLPMWTPNLADARPALLAIALSVAHSAAGELLVQRSLGKILIGARVVSAGGGRPTVLALLVRNAVKALVLLVPVLVVVTAMNPNRQGIEDLAARTLVVAARRPARGGRPQ